MTEQRYTLVEAQAELARRKCVRHGHDYNHLRDLGGTLIRIVCSRCGKAWTVVAEVKSDA